VSRPPSRRPGSSTAHGTREPPPIESIRRRFLTEGIAPTCEVPAPILRSWLRSANHGLDMDQKPAIEALTMPRLKEARERNEMLLRASRGEIEALYEDARITGGIVILTDPEGLVLATVGNTDFAERASRVALRPGVDWGEATIGTNAIGTAIAETCEISVRGAEHFFGAHHILSCSAVPILDPAGQIIGVLDLSNSSRLVQTHTLALVKRAVEQIERRLFERRFGAHDRVHFHADPSLVDGPHEGLLAFEEDRLVGANRYGLQLLGLEWSVLGNMRFREIFDADLRSLIGDRPPEENRIRTFRGSTMFARMEPSRRAMAAHSSDRPTGAVRVEPVAFFDERVTRSLERAVRLSDAGLPILVQGEIGTGKEIFARRLHAAGRRQAGAFVVVDCSAHDSAELEAVLFDPISGAIAQAEGGVLFLEAIEALPMAVQGRLVGLLVRGPGRTGERPPPDAAVVVATHCRLPDRVAQGAFRQDLMMAVGAYTVDLEPLRRHPDRASLIADLWARVAPSRLRGRLLTETAAQLAAYDWPGNHRQLLATLRALVVLAEAGERLDPETLPVEIRESREAASEATVELDVEVGLETITLAAMQAAVEAEGGNVSRAARRLGIHRSTLYRRLFSRDK
jgi:transcriptional regulator of acetoin/glycerol metabolism